MLIRFDHVQKQYQDFHLDCSLEIEPGTVTGLIGPNGSGKSTTFKILLGLVFPDSGKAELFGKPCGELTKKERELLGVVLSDSGFSGYLSIRDIACVLQRLYADFQKEAFFKKCGHFALPLDKKIKDFSTGMKAKLKILTAMSHDTRLLVLDEPTAGLDVLGRKEILDMLREYMEQKDRSVLISSHISSDLEDFCDDYYLIHKGRICLHEDSETLMERYGVLKVTEEQYGSLDGGYLLRKKKESYGFSCLTSQRQFYQENYPKLTIEKGNIDDILTMMIQGEKL